MKQTRGGDRWQSAQLTGVTASRAGAADRGVWMKPALIFPRVAWNGAGMSILSGHARVAGIAGWPVTYSRSPRLHGFWLQRHGIDGAYIPLPIRAGEFAIAMRGLLAAGFAGANVTIPHKLAAFDICDTVDDTARRAGAVNTLVFRDGRIAGSNTDGYGFVANLRAHGVDPAAGPALLLGAGGSARAVAAALLDAGAPVTVANRTRGRAEALARDLPGLRVADWDARAAALRRPCAGGEHHAAGHGRARAARSRSVAARRPRWWWPTTSMCRWKRRCWRRPAAAGFAAWKVSACCCIRRCPASTPGSASNLAWTRSFASSSPPTC